VTTIATRAVTPPRTDVLRSSPFAVRAAEGGDPGDGLTLDGYAAVFGRKALIDSWEGRFYEQIAPGSMKKSFREQPPVIQFEHGRHPLIGSLPIAELTRIEEASDPDLAPDGGAHVVGRLTDNWLVQPVRDAIANRSVNGMSFRFTVVRETWTDAGGKTIRDEDQLRELLRRTWYEDVPDEELLTRTLKELRVPELGPVVFPAYAETSVGVRSMLGRLDELQPAELTTLAERIEDLTGRPSARGAGGGDPDTDPGNGPVTKPSIDQLRLNERALKALGAL
jgi:HK97 family phage prohead protease